MHQNRSISTLLTPFDHFQKRVFGRLISWHLLRCCHSMLMPLQSRAHWQIFFFHFNFWYTFSSVFFNSKTGLFLYIFWFEDSFLCKFTYLHLLSRLQGRIRQKIYDGRKKYFGLTNVSFQCHTSSWNTPITMRKWFQNFTKVSGSPIFCHLKTAIFTNIGRHKIGPP